MSTPTQSRASLQAELQADLLAWGRTNRRSLPWRDTRDPWQILVSEIMLQQTQVDRVIPRFGAFVQRFPTTAACAAASPAEVITLWSGLGYNRRALYLHQAAHEVERRWAGEFPRSLPDLMALPGIGPYTARAVLAFAFEHDAGPVDTNIGRILARWTGETLGGRAAQDTADAWVPEGDGWAWNQTLMDFGAAICTRREPRCDQCPVRSRCGFAGNGVDPATGSAGVTGRQSRFAGSDRQGRGRLVEALRAGPVAKQMVAEITGWVDDPERCDRVIAGLVRDGLIESAGPRWRLVR